VLTDLYVFSEIYQNLLIEAVDDKINEVFLSYPVVCFGRLHVFSKQALPLTRCDRLSLDPALYL